MVRNVCLWKWGEEGEKRQTGFFIFIVGWGNISAEKSGREEEEVENIIMKLPTSYDRADCLSAV